MYVPDPETAAREMWRAARPGGRTVVSVWGQRSRCGWAEVFPIVDARVKSDVCPLFFRLGTGGALQAALREAGFVDIVVERMVTHLSFADGDDVCRAAFLGGPVALAYARFDAATRSAVHAEYLASIRAIGTARATSCRESSSSPQVASRVRARVGRQPTSLPPREARHVRSNHS